MRLLVLNAGSSTLKASVLEPPAREALAVATVDWGSDATRVAGRLDDLRRLLARFEAAGVGAASFEVVGHRVVHGGTRFTAPTVVDDAVLVELAELSPLAPLHNSIAVETIAAARTALSGVPQIAVFDTAFHATLEPSAYRYPLPEAWYRDWGIRRFGFHGLSVAWATDRAAELLGRPAGSLGLLVAHLGSGCSVTAVDAGRSVATSMGLTPLEGLMMGTRAGSIDPGIVLALLRDGRLALDELADALDHGSGLLGVSGRTADMRELLGAEADGDERAAGAIELFVRRAAEGIAAMATALPRLDALVFTGGIGEHAAPVRERIVGRLGVLGLEPLAPAAGARAAGGAARATGGATGGAATRAAARATGADGLLSAPGAAIAVLRVEAREDLVIAREAERLAGVG